ncbi:hypothetical protein [Thalassobius sp. MITS945101]|uniref:hypothetical protein n=1 Tax=Thalassobius sp. MITS945101 TaxID=3096994 RepID=UPI00399B6601
MKATDVPLDMKSATLSYHKEFPWTPMSGWVGARKTGYVRQSSASGQFKRPKSIVHPFWSQRRMWCLLSVHFHGVDLRFAFPQELDHFLEILEQKHLPSGFSLLPGQQLVGRPNNHWLSRLPAKAKRWKFRQQLCVFLRDSSQVLQFRSFYAADVVQTEFEGVYRSIHGASGIQGAD